MHFQARISDWPLAIPALPDNGLVKSVGDPSLLRDAVQTWVAAGRERRQLTTCYRHFDIAMPPRGWNWEEMKLWWRLMFFRFVDKTYLERHANSIDLVQGMNEHTATSTWANLADKAYHLQSEQAAAHVWNREFRGRRVTSLDGGQGDIPDTCKLTLLSGPVSNDIPREICELALAEDCPIDYHAYSRWSRGVRYENDWKDDSGRWAMHEAHYGLKPQWVFGECGPYLGVVEGWRHPDVLGGDLNSLIQAMRVWYTDVTATAAFREGRILGQGAWFTSGNDPTWRYYQLNTPDLVALATAIRDLWRKEVIVVTVTGNTEDELNETLRQLAGYTILQRGVVHWAQVEVERSQPPFYTRLAVGTRLRVVRPEGLMVYLDSGLAQKWSRGLLKNGDISMVVALPYNPALDLQRVGVLCVLKPGLSTSFPDGLWIAAVGGDGLPNVESA